PRGLQLMNVPQPLHPRMIDQFLLRNFPRRQPRPRHERDIPVDRIVRKTFRGEVAGHCGVRMTNVESMTRLEWWTTHSARVSCDRRSHKARGDLRSAGVDRKSTR